MSADLDLPAPARPDPAYVAEMELRRRAKDRARHQMADEDPEKFLRYYRDALKSARAARGRARKESDPSSRAG